VLLLTLINNVNSVHRSPARRLRGTDLAPPRPTTPNRSSLRQQNLRARSEKSSSAQSVLRRLNQIENFNQKAAGNNSRSPIKTTKRGSSVSL
jgi:hypothetical protein